MKMNSEDEFKFKSILDTIPMAVVVLVNRHITFANRAVERVLGWKSEELLGKTTEVLYRNKQEYEEIGKIIYSLLVSQDTISQVFPSRHHDGHHIICNIIATRMNEDLKEKEVVVVYEDITSRIETEKELARNEEEYRTYIENAHDIILAMTPEAKMLDGNNTFFNLLGYNKEELENIEIAELVHKDDEELFQTAFQATLLNKPSKNMLTRFQAKDGRVLYFEGTLVPKNFYGKVITVTAFYRDQTEKISAHLKIQEKIEELEKFNKIVVDRELKMIELKEKVRELEERK